MILINLSDDDRAHLTELLGDNIKHYLTYSSINSPNNCSPETLTFITLGYETSTLTSSDVLIGEMAAEIERDVVQAILGELDRWRIK